MAEEEQKPKNAGGRPSKYKSEYCEIEPFLDKCKAEKQLPTLCGYAVYINAIEKTLYAWAKKKPRFRKSLDVILTLQKLNLIHNGLTGAYNSNIVKLLLSYNHGISERQEQVLDVTDKLARFLETITDGKLRCPSDSED